MVCCTPFDYVLKQIHKQWMPWLYPNGWANTGKTTLGEKLCNSIWNRYKNNDAEIPYTAADTPLDWGNL